MADMSLLFTVVAMLGVAFAMFVATGESGAPPAAARRGRLAAAVLATVTIAALAAALPY